MKLRPYQAQCVQQVSEKLSTHGRVLLIAGTGAGKTIMASRLIVDLVAKDWRTLFLVHRDILIQQTVEKLVNTDLSYGIIAGDYPINLKAQVQIASIQTLSRRGKQWLLENFPFQVAIFDEAHLTNWFKFALELFPPLPHTQKTLAIGLTATPWRRSKFQSMGDIYPISVLAPLPHELIEQGFLVPFSYYSIGKLERQGLILKNGEYTQASLKVKCNTPEMIRHIVEQWKLRASDRRTIVFAIDIEHSRQIAQAFSECGITAASVDGTMAIKTREQLYGQLAKGQLQVLCSCEALSEGFDVPVVSCVVLARLTTSKAKYFQQIGRGARILPGIKRDCMILDPVGLVSDFGFLESLSEEDFSLSPCEREALQKGTAPVKNCPNCSRLILATYPKCPQCDYVFPLKTAVASPQALHHQIPLNQQEKYHYYQSLLRQAYTEQVSFNWCDQVYKGKYGIYPPLSWRKGAIFGDNPTASQLQEYRRYLHAITNQSNLTSEISDWMEKNLWG